MVQRGGSRFTRACASRLPTPPDCSLVGVGGRTQVPWELRSWLAEPSQLRAPTHPRTDAVLLLLGRASQLNTRDRLGDDQRVAG